MMKLKTLITEAKELPERDIKLLAKIAFSNPINHKILNGIMWPEIFMLINKDRAIIMS